jgi:hypothetical protein
MTAEDIARQRMADNVREGRDLGCYLTLLRDVQYGEQCMEAESMAVETQDAADADLAGLPFDPVTGAPINVLDLPYTYSAASRPGLPAGGRPSSLAASPEEDEHRNGDRDGLGACRGLLSVLKLLIGVGAVLFAGWGWAVLVLGLGQR